MLEFNQEFKALECTYNIFLALLLFLMADMLCVKFQAVTSEQVDNVNLSAALITVLVSTPRCCFKDLLQ